MKSVFVDTAELIALGNKQDQICEISLCVPLCLCASVVCWKLR